MTFRCRSEETLEDEEGVEWGAEPLRIRYALLVDSKPISTAQEIKPSKITSVTAVFVRREKAFTDSMQSLLRYVRVVKEDYGVCFVNERMMDILGDMMFSIVSAANFRATYICYISAGKIMIKYQDVLSSLVKLGRDAPAAKPLGITPLDQSSI